MWRAMPISAVFLGTLQASCVVAQTPPPHVHYDMPFSAQVTGVYDCPGGEVRLTLAARRAWNGEPAYVRVTSYEVGGRAATPSELARWNTWLRDLTELHTSGVLCQSDNNQRITIRGKVQGNRTKEVEVYWWRGQLGLLPTP